ncbi:unnamed protein product [Phytophthora lilii]|uniref:Unnamed protein product n=1 Tax=Phytophthora lilii TaxID=2077276 RepID=A0A9W6TPQ6_9STRA|nr:unnamed protein product [Phytophthora lilii]
MTDGTTLTILKDALQYHSSGWFWHAVKDKVRQEEPPHVCACRRSEEGARQPVKADRLPITINGQKAYGVWIDSGMGYRNDKTSGIPTGDDAEAIYMVADGTHFNGGCCSTTVTPRPTTSTTGPPPWRPSTSAISVSGATMVRARARG